MLNMGKTTEQLIYEKTCQDEFENFATSIEEESIKPGTKENTTNAFPSFSMNRLVYSLTFNEKINTLMSKYHSHKFGGRVLGYRGDVNMSSYIDIAKIGNHTFTFKESMDIIRQMREAVGPEVFYGAVIVNNQHVDVNPLHPLVLNEFMAMSEEELVYHELTNYSVIIYTFKEKWKTFREDYPKKFKVKEEYSQNILDLILGTKFKRESFTISSNPEMILKNNKYIIEYSEKIVDQEGNEIPVEDDARDKMKQGYVIPGQILNLSGITYPYYGAIYVKGGKSWNLSPMWATNINNPQSNGEGSVKKGSNICTKVGDARTANGCKTLNHSNTTSERNPETFTDGAMGYAQVAVDIALSMFYNDYNGTIKLDPKDKKMTLQEFLNTDPLELTKKDYIEYIRNRLKERMQ